MSFKQPNYDELFGGAKAKARKAEKKIDKAQKQLDKGHIAKAEKKLNKATKKLSKTPTPLMSPIRDKIVEKRAAVSEAKENIATLKNDLAPKPSVSQTPLTDTGQVTTFDTPTKDGATLATGTGSTVSSGGGGGGMDSGGSYFPDSSQNSQQAYKDGENGDQIEKTGNDSDGATVPAWGFKTILIALVVLVAVMYFLIKKPLKP